MIKKLTDTYAHFDVLLLLSFIDNALDAGNMFTWYKDPSAESFSRQGFPLRDAYEINDATSMSATKRENEIKDWMCAEAEGQENNLTSCIFVAACSPTHYDADNFPPHCMAFIYCSCRSSASFQSLSPSLLSFTFMVVSFKSYCIPLKAKLAETVVETSAGNYTNIFNSLFQLLRYPMTRCWKNTWVSYFTFVCEIRLRTLDCTHNVQGLLDVCLHH